MEKNSSDNYATRHGITSKSQEKTAVIRTLKENGHKLLKIFNSCAVIDHDHRFLPAYVDQVISCQ